jgi:hypothetical protein
MKGSFLTMKTWVRKSLSIGVLAAGAVLFSGTAAMAANSATTTSNNGIGNGTQIVAPIQVPLDLCGNAVAGAGGGSFASCDGGATATYEATGADLSSSDNNGIGNGTQVYAPIQVPVDVCGNAVSGFGGAAFAGCEGGASAGNGGDENGGYTEATRTNKAARDAQRAAALQMVSSGNNGIANGTQVYAPIQVPINVCGVSVAGVGGVSFADCTGGSSATMESTRTEGASLNTSDNNGIGNGTQAYVPVQAPIDISGNAVSGFIGAAFASSTGGSSATMTERSATEALPVLGSLPVGNLLGTLGGVKQASPVHTEAAGKGDLTTAGNNGIGNGTQVFAPIQIPVDVSGNAVAGFGGVSFASSTGGVSATR